MATKNSAIEIDSKVVNVRVMIDEFLEEVKEVETEVKYLEEMQKIAQQQLEEKYTIAKEPHIKKRTQLLEQITALFNESNPSSTKTQYKTTLPHGDVIMEKARVDFDYNKEKLLFWAEQSNQDEFIAIKETKDFRWSEFKKRLKIV